MKRILKRAPNQCINPLPTLPDCSLTLLMAYTSFTLDRVMSDNVTLRREMLLWNTSQGNSEQTRF